jgi:hypothetical protein
MRDALPAAEPPRGARVSECLQALLGRLALLLRLLDGLGSLLASSLVARAARLAGHAQGADSDGDHERDDREEHGGDGSTAHGGSSFGLRHGR